MDRITMGGRMVPTTAVIMPSSPSTCHPTRIAAVSYTHLDVYKRQIQDAAMTRRHVVAWHKEKYLKASMRRFITLCRSTAEEVEKK